MLVSTDKAVRPTNVMGATKRFAELILQAFADQAAKPNFSMVRFGNVLESSGSVVPLFKRQIEMGGPVTVTDPEVTRYFMTIPEAARLVVQAGAMSLGGDVFVLEMGEPIRIADLAQRMIHLSGLRVRSASDDSACRGTTPALVGGVPVARRFAKCVRSARYGTGARGAGRSGRGVLPAGPDALAGGAYASQVVRNSGREYECQSLRAPATNARRI